MKWNQLVIKVYDIERTKILKSCIHGWFTHDPRFDFVKRRKKLVRRSVVEGLHHQELQVPYILSKQEATKIPHSKCCCENIT